MAECMTFPDDWREFLKDYSFIDSDHVYTNGSELIPVFRVEQLIEHILAKYEPKVMRQNEKDTAYNPWKNFIQAVAEETPDPCKNCSNHPSNGGSGICNCILGSPKVTV